MHNATREPCICRNGRTRSAIRIKIIEGKKVFLYPITRPVRKEQDKKFFTLSLLVVVCESFVVIDTYIYFTTFSFTIRFDKSAL